MEIKLKLEPGVALFYMRVAALTGLPLDRVIGDALLRLAGELSLEALRQNNFEKPL